MLAIIFSFIASIIRGVLGDVIKDRINKPDVVSVEYSAPVAVPPAVATVDQLLAKYGGMPDAVPPRR